MDENTRLVIATYAMQGMLANPNLTGCGDTFDPGTAFNIDSHEHRAALVFKARQFADQLISELKE